MEVAEGPGSDGLVRPAVEAAVVVARLGAAADPAVPVPRGLRPFLRFTRLPDRAIGAARRVLDDDAEFRRLVRDATSEELVGRASWLFLDRPEGWEAELSQLTEVSRAEQEADTERRAESSALKRLAAVDDARRRAEELVVRLRLEVADAKGQLAVERRARHLVETEAGRLRRGMEEARAEIDALRAVVADLEVALDAQQRDLEPSIASEAVSSEPDAATMVTSGAPVLRHDVVAAAHAVAVAAADTLAAALADLGATLRPTPPVADDALDGPALHESPSGRRAPASRRQPLSLPPAVLDDSVAAAEHLLRVQDVLVLVDGYNVTKLARPEFGLSEQRRWLLDAALESATRTGARFELVFDGVDDRESAPADLARRSRVQMRFSPAGVEADDVVLARAEELASVPVVVASDDRRVRDGARALGVNVVGARQLLGAMKRPIDH